MSNHQKAILVITTCTNDEQAKKLAKQILKVGLAGCIQLDKVKSLYLWQEKICNESEIRLMIKTSHQNYAKLEKFIEINHPYDTPEIIAIEIKKSSQKYLTWLFENCS